MYELKSHQKIIISSEKNFGIVISIVFLLIGIYQFAVHQHIIMWIFFVSIILLVLAIYFPRLLIWPNFFWYKIGIFLGYIISPIVMLLIFFLTIVPTGIVMRLLGKDLLSLKMNKSEKTYWIQRKKNVGSMKDQF